jgi:hypothetical protein
MISSVASVVCPKEYARGDILFNWNSRRGMSVLLSLLRWTGKQGLTRRIACPDIPAPFSPPLQKAYMPGKEMIERAVREIV